MEESYSFFLSLYLEALFRVSENILLFRGLLYFCSGSGFRGVLFDPHDHGVLIRRYKKLPQSREK